MKCQQLLRKMQINWKFLKSMTKMKPTYLNVLKDVGDNSEDKHYKNMLKCVRRYSNLNEKNLIQKKLG